MSSSVGPDIVTRQPMAIFHPHVRPPEKLILSPVEFSIILEQGF
jgi:hypothetical protein